MFADVHAQIWSEEELGRLLTKEDSKIFGLYYGIEPEGNVDSDRDPHEEFTGRSTLQSAGMFLYHS